MRGSELLLGNPGDADVTVASVFTESMFQELKALMLECNFQGLEEVESEMWRGGELGLMHRRIISEFMKDKILGSKRLVSMPDRVTNTIHVVTRAASAYKPPP
eukprot:4156656-Amphidinium_carterae.1